MRRFTFLTFATAVLCSSALLAPTAVAADAGTYRPGNAYNSITANTPDICEMQCSGDAQCRSWNFVRISDMSEGVCEFNDNISSPVPSAISISGDNVSRARAPRVVTGQTNTVRVGAPTAALTSSQPRTSAPSYAPAPPQYRPMQQSVAAPRAPQVSPNQFRHSLEEGRPAFAQTAPRPQMAPTAQIPSAAQMTTAAPPAYAHADPRLQQQLQQRLQAAQNQPPALTYPPTAPASAPQNLAAAGTGYASPPGVPPLLEGSASYMSPEMAGAPQPPRRVNIPLELAPRAMGSGDSLFGSLYDDVKVPRPIDPS